MAADMTLGRVRLCLVASGLVALVGCSATGPYVWAESLPASAGGSTDGVIIQDGDTGVLVPPNDPSELAIAIADLLRTPARRRALGDAARQRALNHFTVDRVVRVYGALYTDLAAPPPAAAFPLALTVPAPRTTMSATVRWLIRETT